MAGSSATRLLNTSQAVRPPAGLQVANSPAFDLPNGSPWTREAWGYANGVQVHVARRPRWTIRNPAPFRIASRRQDWESGEWFGRAEVLIAPGRSPSRTPVACSGDYDIKETGW